MDTHYDHKELIKMLEKLQWEKVGSENNPNIQVWHPTEESPQNPYLHPFESHSIVVPLSTDAPDYQSILKRSMFALVEYSIDPLKAFSEKFGE